MSNVAVVIGNAHYQTLLPLTCCKDDVVAMKELLDATERFDRVEVFLDTTSSDLKDRIRSTIDAYPSVEEIFFYYTGHGFQLESEFFYCASNFDPKRPHETGLSNSDLHVLLRASEANLVVKVIDACSSGTLLIKADVLQPSSKKGFKNLIQIASCLDSQSSLTGDPLSLFTEKFRAAVLRKDNGVVYYTDIIDALRDEFLDNDSQTPHFVSQGTGREYFVENAVRFNDLRSKLSDAAPIVTQVAIQPVTLQPIGAVEVLRNAESNYATKYRAESFISELFDELCAQLSTEGPFSDMFVYESIIHSDFQEDATHDFIVSILSKEKRRDNFVRAAITYGNQARELYGINLSALANLAGIPPQYELELNCKLEKVQLKITLTPKFIALKQYVLVVSCAPSLETCYVMEHLTSHLLSDWGVYDSAGVVVSKRWYKKTWTDDCGSIVKKIVDVMRDSVQEGIDMTVKSLSS